MNTSPDIDTVLHQTSRRLARSEPEELRLPLTWPEVLKLMMQLAVVWAIMLGSLLVLVLGGGHIGS